MITAKIVSSQRAKLSKSASKMLQNERLNINMSDMKSPASSNASLYFSLLSNLTGKSETA